MIKQGFAVAAMLCAAASAWAAVDVNVAGEDALVGIKGIGPAKARAIVDERDAHGPFKDVDDLASRVKGIGGGTIERLQREGLTIGAAAGVGAVGSSVIGSSAPGSSVTGSGAAGAIAKPASPAASAKAADTRAAAKK